MDKEKLTRSDEDRAVYIADHIWSALTKDERELWYGGTGTIGFIEEVIYILHFNRNHEVTEDFTERVHNRVFCWRHYI